jgi:hypothetical protein
MRPSRISICGLLLLSSVVSLASAQETCNAPLGWWESQGLEPLFTDPNGPSPTTDCSFQVWSWTAFVHWMQTDPTTGQPLFLGLPTYDDLKPGATKQSSPKMLQLQPRTLKPDGLGGEIQQAGSDGIIVDQQGRVVYYSTHMDPIYFTVTQKFFGPKNYAQAPPTLNYPIGATVFKVSWRVLDPNETAPTDALVIPAMISQLDNSSGGAHATATMIPAQAVMVGVHVVGVIKDHPEFAWGTFEHNGNAPNLPAGMSPKSGSSVSDQSFAFYKAQTAASACNNLAQVNLTAPPMQTAAPMTNIFRQYEFGGATDDRVADIVSANQNFQTAIKEGQKTVNPVFANYSLVGTVWQQANTLKPGNSNMGASAIGSPDLANATMETYVQGTNCFSCHNTGSGKNIALSHILLSASKAKAPTPK